MFVIRVKNYLEIEYYSALKGFWCKALKNNKIKGCLNFTLSTQFSDLIILII